MNETQWNFCQRAWNVNVFIYSRAQIKSKCINSNVRKSNHDHGIFFRFEIIFPYYVCENKHNSQLSTRLDDFHFDYYASDRYRTSRMCIALSYLSNETIHARKFRVEKKFPGNEKKMYSSSTDSVLKKKSIYQFWLRTLRKCKNKLFWLFYSPSTTNWTTIHVCSTSIEIAFSLRDPQYSSPQPKTTYKVRYRIFLCAAWYAARPPLKESIGFAEIFEKSDN